jgi:eukaryotic-like serine/threonine-protein kinase
MAQAQQRYKVLEKIASGGMAEVFRAESAGLEGFKKTVAIKRVLPHLSEKKQFIGMFLDEARLSAHLSHSNCVQVFDIGVGDNTYFIVMEFVDGSDLKAVIEHQKKSGRTFPVEEACLICVRLCEGLSYAHELIDAKGQNLGIVHRDMSPPNVLITRHGEVKIVDFGLAKANSQLEQSEPGIIKGKFSYLSPEAALGHPVDARTDIFAIGIILWELLAGRRLFIGESDLETVRQVQAARVPSIRRINPQVPPELDVIVAKALARDPNQRYQAARDLGRDLNSIMFHFGRAVSSFDIAAMVEPVWRDRERTKTRKADKGSIIGTLIDEALFEFTSLDRESKDQSQIAGAAPLNIGSFENVQDWAGDLGDLAGYSEPEPQQNQLPSERFELGNLAALEDDSPSAQRERSAAPAESSEPPAPVSEPPSMPPASGPSSPRPIAIPVEQKPPSRGGLIALIVVVLIVALVAGAYFGGLFPRSN